MPIIKTSRPCVYMEADAYILVHNNNSQRDFLLRRVFSQAGPQLREAYDNSGIMPYGDPVITPGFGLKANYVIHILQTTAREKDSSTLEQYRKALLLAQAHHCESVVFAMPPQYAEYEKANSVCREFAMESDMDIYQSGAVNCMEISIGDVLYRLTKYLQIDSEVFQGEITSSHSAYEADDLTEYCAAPSALEADETEDCAIWDERTVAPSKMSFDERHKSREEFRAIQEYLRQNDAGFKDTLLKCIDRTGKKDSEIYKKANVDRRLFSKILNVQGYNPSKPTAIAFAIALELNLEETKDLIGRAGYTLSQASTFDRIIEFFILERNYNIYEINEALFYFDQNLLGC